MVWGLYGGCMGVVKEAGDTVGTTGGTGRATRERARDREREGGREGGREGEREGGREGGRKRSSSGAEDVTQGAFRMQVCRGSPKHKPMCAGDEAHSRQQRYPTKARGAGPCRQALPTALSMRTPTVPALRLPREAFIRRSSGLKRLQSNKKSARELSPSGLHRRVAWDTSPEGGSPMGRFLAWAVGAALGSGAVVRPPEACTVMRPLPQGLA